MTLCVLQKLSQWWLLSYFINIILLALTLSSVLPVLLFRHYHCLKKMEKGQPQNSVPIHLCFGITKDAIKEDFSDQKELCPCSERQRLNYWRNSSFSLTSKGKKRAFLTQKATVFSLLVGKVTMLLNFCDVPGVCKGTIHMRSYFALTKMFHPLSLLVLPGFFSRQETSSDVSSTPLCGQGM